MTLRPFNVLIFDWDGTLMDSHGRIVSCMQKAAISMGVVPPSSEQGRSVIGLGLNEAVTALYPDADNEFIQTMSTYYRQYFFSEAAEPQPLYPGVEELLENFKKQGYLLAVATGKSRAGLDVVMDETGLKDLFVFTRCADESESKPNPKMLEDIISSLRVGVDETLMVGDTSFDLQMAANIGMAAIGVDHGAHDISRLWACEPLDIIENICDLGPWLEKASKPRRDIDDQVTTSG